MLSALLLWYLSDNKEIRSCIRTLERGTLNEWVTSHTTGRWDSWGSGSSRWRCLRPALCYKSLQVPNRLQCRARRIQVTGFHQTSSGPTHFCFHELRFRFLPPVSRSPSDSNTRHVGNHPDPFYQTEEKNSTAAHSHQISDFLMWRTTSSVQRFNQRLMFLHL